MADEKKKQEFHYGGQAVIEGVMMRGPKHFGVAVRRESGEIVTKAEDVESVLGKFQWLNKPFLRGTLTLIDSMALGIKALMYSANEAMKDIPDESRKKADAAGLESAQPVTDPAPDPVADSKAEKNEGKAINDITIGAMTVLGLVLGLAVFFFVPILITRPVKTAFDLSGSNAAAIEGCIKIAMFIGYVWVISFMKDIRRVFQYHGAEHKTINAHESGVELTVENVVNYPKEHVRCGTSFILVVLVTSIIVFSFIPWNSIIERFAYKLLLLPVVAGISYEVIRFAGKHKDSFFARVLVLPGLLMQRITTREPEPEMIEVAIASLNCVFEAERAVEQSDPATA